MNIRIPQFVTAIAGVNLPISQDWNNIAIIPGAGGSVTVTNTDGTFISISQPIVLGGTNDNSFDNIWGALTIMASVSNAQIVVNGNVALGGGGTGASNLSGYIPFSDQNYTSVKANGNATANGTALMAAVAAAKLLTPNGVALSATNRAVVYIFDAAYNTGSSAIALGNFVDIIGIGDAKDIIITSSNATGTIQIANSNDYILKNLTINNTGGGGSITHNTGQTDSGKWESLILNAPNTIDTVFSGTYNYLTGAVDSILNGSISGSVFKSSFQNYSCGSSANSGSTTISGTINNCSGLEFCFGYVNNGSVTISGTINNCSVTDSGLGYALNNGNVTISGNINNCSGSSSVFGFSQSGNIIISGNILNCTGGSNSFAYSTSGNVTVSGKIDNCNIGSGTTSFCSTMSGVSSVSGTISNCVGTTSCFGSTTSVGKIINCIRTSGYGTHLGAILNCTFSDNSANPALTVGAGARIKYSTIYQAGAGDTIKGSAAISAIVTHCYLNKALNGNVTNSIATPYNVVDAAAII